MIHPSYELLRQLYPRKDTREVLFSDIGWSDLTNNKAYWDTCAIRMSIGLLRAGVQLPGARMQAKAGTIKGQWIEPGQAKLSAILTHIWGRPEVYTSEQLANGAIGSRHGVVSFFRIEGGNGGHIDLIQMGEHGFLDCARSCFFSALTIWFWPLT
jgi:hypothetical protein